MQDAPQMGVYTITNTVNGLVYVGSSAHIARRWRQHRDSLKRNVHHTTRLQSDWNIFVPTDFVLALVEPVGNKADLLDAEQRWLDKLDTANPVHGYNEFRNSRGALGYVFGPDARGHMSVSAKRRGISPEARAKMVAAMPGHKKNPATRQNRVDAQKKRASQYSKEWLSERGRKGAASFTPEMYAAAAEKRRGRVQSPEERAMRLELMAQFRGTGNPAAKLDENKVRQIKQGLANAVPKMTLARQFGVSGMTIRRIELGKNWTHVTID